MLFFVDESWQTIAGTRVGALGAVAIPQRGYNGFCREVFAMKRDLLGATELNQSEIKGQHVFAKSAFKSMALSGESHWLAVAERFFDLLERHHARTFAVWTDNPQFVSLRSSHTTVLSKLYKDLLWDFLRFMKDEARKSFGSLNFDQRGLKEDEAVGCAVQNYLVRTDQSPGWGQKFIQVPSFTVSAVSPGLQAADVVAHLVAHLVAPEERPELAPYLARVSALAYVKTHGRGPHRTRRQCITRVP